MIEMQMIDAETLANLKASSGQAISQQATRRAK
jgi:hypothetical protein